MTQKKLAVAQPLRHEEGMTTTHKDRAKDLKKQLEELMQTASTILRDQGTTSVESIRADLGGHFSDENVDLMLQVMEQRGQIKREGNTIRWAGSPHQ